MGSDQSDEGAILQALAAAGYGAESAPLRPEFRRWRWVAMLPASRVAFFADEPQSAGRLSLEQALLDLLARRVRHFAVPTVEHVSPDGRLQVRRIVEGIEVPGGYGRDRALGLSPVGGRFADELGRALAELHGAATPAEVRALGLPMQEPFRPVADQLRERLRGRLPDPTLASVLDPALDAYAALDEEDVGHTLTHGDIGFHNLAVDPGTGRLLGIFDFDLASLGDRHVDLWGLHSYDDAFVARALDAYTAQAGARPSERRAALHHLCGAFDALASALETGDQYWIDRRLRWARDALARSPGRLLGLRPGG